VTSPVASASSTSDWSHDGSLTIGVTSPTRTPVRVPPTSSEFATLLWMPT
jgi:hypothetical protein